MITEAAAHDPGDRSIALRLPERPAEMLSAICRGQAPMLSKTEWAMLKQHAKDRVRRFDAEIENRLRLGDLRAAKHKARKMLACPAARLVGLIRSNAKLKPTKRRDHAALIAEIGAVDVFRRAASPCMEWQPKPDGGSRPIYKFGLVDGACAALIAMVLKPFARAHPRLACHPAQVLLAGGSPAACERLRSALEQAPDGAAFVHIDVRRFYQSMTCNGLARMTGLPPEVIHRHLSVEHLKVRPGNSKEYLTGQGNVGPGVRHSAPCKPERESPEVLSGLTTGSAASSTVAEIVMGHILQASSAFAFEGLLPAPAPGFLIQENWTLNPSSSRMCFTAWRNDTRLKKGSLRHGLEAFLATHGAVLLPEQRESLDKALAILSDGKFAMASYGVSETDCANDLYDILKDLEARLISQVRGQSVEQK